MKNKKTKILTIVGVVVVLCICIVAVVMVTGKNKDKVDKNGLTKSDNKALKEILKDIDYMYDKNAYVPVQLDKNESEDSGRLLFLNKNKTVYEEYGDAVSIYYSDKDRIKMTSIPEKDNEVNVVSYIKGMANFINKGNGSVSKEVDGEVSKYTMKIKSTDNIKEFYEFLVDKQYCEDVWDTKFNNEIAENFKDKNYIQIRFNWKKDNSLYAECESNINGETTTSWIINRYFELEDWDTCVDWSKVDVSNRDTVKTNIQKLQKSLSKVFKSVAKKLDAENESTNTNDEEYNSSQLEKDEKAEEEYLEQQEKAEKERIKNKLSKKSDEELKNLVEKAKKIVNEKGMEYLDTEQEYAYYYGEEVLQERNNK